MITVGTKIADYKITKLLTSDKTGNTCLATDTQLDKSVIIKFISPNDILKQVQQSMRLSHPNIISVYETGEYNSQNYLVMEYVIGKPLSEFIEEGSVSTEFTIDVGLQISDALAYAHSESIIHGSIASSNIIIDIDGRPRLSDFGLYNDKKNNQDDLRSLGTLLYEMLTGKSHSGAFSETKLRLDLGDVSDKLTAIILKLLSNNKADCCNTVDELYNDLVSLPQSKKLSSQKPVDWWNRIVVPIAFIILVIAAIYWLFYRNK
jgi:serine/threonine protein kinase